MQKVEFGRMGDAVTRIGFGAWALGSKSYGEVNPSQARATLDTYLSAGGSFIDTARGYRTSESIIGEHLAETGRRDEVFLCSKSGKLTETEIRRDLEESLRNLRTDRLDLYYLHGPPEEPEQMDEVLTVFEALRQEGMIRGIGASVKGPSVTTGIVQLASDYISTGRVDALQIIFSIFRQDHRAIFDQARTAGVALVGRTILESGFLTGKFHRDHSFAEGDHRNRWHRDKREAVLAASEELAEEFAQPPYSDLASFAQRFAFDEPGLTVTIPGAKSPDQERANLAIENLPPIPASVRDELAKRFEGKASLVNLGE